MLFHDEYNYYLLKFIRFAMNNRYKLFKEFMNHIYLYKNYYHTRNQRFNLPPVKLDVERNLTSFQSIKCFNIASAQLCVPMSDYAFKMNYKKVVLESY